MAKHSRCAQLDFYGFQMIWAPGTEPWRECGLPVHEELDLDPAKVELIHETSRQYFLKYRQVCVVSRPPSHLPPVPIDTHTHIHEMQHGA